MFSRKHSDENSIRVCSVDIDNHPDPNDHWLCVVHIPGVEQSSQA